MIHAVYPFNPEDLDRAILFDGIVGRQSSAVMSSSSTIQAQTFYEQRPPTDPKALLPPSQHPPFATIPTTPALQSSENSW